MVGGIVTVSLASYIFDGNGPPEARICARLRIPLEVAGNIQGLISKAAEDADKARAAAN